MALIHIKAFDDSETQAVIKELSKVLENHGGGEIWFENRVVVGTDPEPVARRRLLERHKQKAKRI